MERIQIFKQLLETEATARSLFDEATERQQGLSQQLEQEIETLRQQAYSEADREIEKAEQLSIAEADEAIAEQDTQHQAHLEAIRRRMERSKTHWADRMFDITVHQ